MSEEKKTVKEIKEEKEAKEAEKTIMGAGLAQGVVQKGTFEVKDTKIFSGENRDSGKPYKILNLLGELTVLDAENKPAKKNDGTENKFEWSMKLLKGHYPREIEVDGKTEKRTYPNSLNIRLDENNLIEAKSILGRFMNKMNVPTMEEFKGRKFAAVRENETWKLDVDLS